MSMIKWVVTNSAAYQKLGKKENNALYFLQDTQEIYKGELSFTQSVVMVNEFGTKGAQGKIYIHNTTLEGRVWVNNDWKTVIEPIATQITDNTPEKKAVSGDAVKAYVQQKIRENVTGKFVEGIEYNKSTKEISYTKNGQTNKLEIGGFVTDVRYSNESGDLSFAVQGGEEIKINIPKHNFVTSGSYDKEKNEIVLVLSNGTNVVIPAADLVDINDYESTDTVEIEVDGGKVSANVIVSNAEGNILQSTDAGLYVAPTDLSNVLNKVDKNKTDEIIIADAEGGVKTSGKKVGGSNLAASPDVNTLATEAAVAAIKATLQQSIDKKFNKEDIVTSIGTVESALDTKVASERAVAVAINKLTTNKIDKTSITEEIPQGIGAVDKVVSERAVISALSWVEIND